MRFFVSCDCTYSIPIANNMKLFRKKNKKNKQKKDENKKTKQQNKNPNPAIYTTQWHNIMQRNLNNIHQIAVVFANEINHKITTSILAK